MRRSEGLQVRREQFGGPPRGLRGGLLIRSRAGGENRRDRIPGPHGPDADRCPASGVRLRRPHQVSSVGDRGTACRSHCTAVSRGRELSAGGRSRVGLAGRYPSGVRGPDGSRHRPSCHLLRARTSGPRHSPGSRGREALAVAARLGLPGQARRPWFPIHLTRRVLDSPRAVQPAAPTFDASWLGWDRSFTRSAVIRRDPCWAMSA